jgi:hypothetical protein
MVLKAHEHLDELVDWYEVFIDIVDWKDAALALMKQTCEQLLTFDVRYFVLPAPTNRRTVLQQQQQQQKKQKKKNYCFLRLSLVENLCLLYIAYA